MGAGKSRRSHHQRVFSQLKADFGVKNTILIEPKGKEDHNGRLMERIRQIVTQEFSTRTDMWNFNYFYLVKEGYATVLDQAELCRQALKQYLELGVMYDNLRKRRRSKLLRHQKEEEEEKGEEEGEEEEVEDRLNNITGVSSVISPFEEEEEGEHDDENDDNDEDTTGEEKKKESSRMKKY
eukprot:jgi/Bigna1/135975/aug1.31_g10683